MCCVHIFGRRILRLDLVPAVVPLALWFAGLFPQGFVAQAAPADRLSSNRWLLVVETSRSMRDRAQAVQTLVGNLVLSRLGRQLQAGDTLGLWTFNQDLYTGQFPLQQWSPGSREAIALRFMTFLKQQKYENTSRLDKVIGAVNELVKASDVLTVVLVSDGSESVQGTPFDDKINEAYRKWRDVQQKAKLPLVTILRAQGGHFTDYAVNTPPWPLEMPPLPPAAVPKPVKRQPAPPPPMAPPLIVHGKKPEPVIKEHEPAPVETSPTPSMSAVVAVSARNVTNSAATASPIEAAAVPRKPATRSRTLWIAGLAVMVLALAFVLLRVRRARSGARSRASLITHSLNRKDE